MAITRTPIIDDDGSGTTGTVLDNAWKQEFYNQIDGATGDGTTGGAVAYTPTWTVPGGASFGLGNGTLIGRYWRVGNLVIASITLTWGSTTAGAGEFCFGLPAAAPWNPSLTAPLAGGFALHGAAYPVFGCYPVDYARMNVFAGHVGIAAVSMSHEVPFMWAAGDKLHEWFLYETTAA